MGMVYDELLDSRDSYEFLQEFLNDCKNLTIVEAERLCKLYSVDPKVIHLLIKPRLTQRLDYSNCDILKEKKYTKGYDLFVDEMFEGTQVLSMEEFKELYTLKSILDYVQDIFTKELKRFISYRYMELMSLKRISKVMKETESSLREYISILRLCFQDSSVKEGLKELMPLWHSYNADHSQLSMLKYHMNKVPERLICKEDRLEAEVLQERVETAEDVIMSNIKTLQLNICRTLKENGLTHRLSEKGIDILKNSKSV